LTNLCNSGSLSKRKPVSFKIHSAAVYYLNTKEHISIAASDSNVNELISRQRCPKRTGIKGQSLIDLTRLSKYEHWRPVMHIFIAVNTKRMWCSVYKPLVQTATPAAAAAAAWAADADGCWETRVEGVWKSAVHLLQQRHSTRPHELAEIACFERMKIIFILRW